MMTQPKTPSWDLEVSWFHLRTTRSRSKCQTSRDVPFWWIPRSRKFFMYNFALNDLNQAILYNIQINVFGFDRKTQLKSGGDICVHLSTAGSRLLSIILRCSVRMGTGPYKWFPHSRLFIMCNFAFNYLKSSYFT